MVASSRTTRKKQVPHMTSNGTNDNCRMYSFKAACYVPEYPTRVEVAFLFLPILSGACGTGEKKEFPGNRAGSWGTSANSHKNKCFTHHLHLTYHCTNSTSSFLKRFSYLSTEAVLARRSRRALGAGRAVGEHGLEISKCIISTKAMKEDKILFTWSSLLPPSP